MISTMKTQSCTIIAAFLALSSTTHGYSNGISPLAPPLLNRARTNPFKTEGLDVNPMDFDGIFGRIKQVSPLANSVFNYNNEKRGLKAIDDRESKNLKWKRIESNKKGVVHQIDRLDNFQGLSAPMLRFRSSIEGPTVGAGEFFGKLIMDLEQRKKWDAQIDDIYELYSINDLDSANIAMGFGRNGDCSKLGVGYCQTKAKLGITPREQLFVFGLQDFTDGSCCIWGTEMDKSCDHLLPEGPRHTRATSHLFSATLTPTSETSFDIEYILQMDIGGNIPKFLTTPVMIDTVKNLFGTAKKEFAAAGEGGALDAHLKEKAEQDSLANRQGLLMTF